MEKNPKISVLMCTYNHEQYIAQAIEGVVNQKCDVPFELLIGEDCSTDGTRKVVQQYAEKYPEIIRPFYHDTNYRMAGNIVDLVTNAQGEFISFCDGDDFWDKDYILQRQIDTFRADPNVGMVCAKSRCYIQSLGAYRGTQGYAGAESLKRMLYDGQDVSAPTISFRKELFLRFMDECQWNVKNDRLYDTVMAYWFAQYSRVRFVDEEWASYRVLDESACHSNDDKQSAIYSRRYFSVKWRYLLEHGGLDTDELYDLLMHEYDQTEAYAYWLGEKKARNSLAYKLGNAMLKPIKILKKWKNQK